MDNSRLLPLLSSETYVVSRIEIGIEKEHVGKKCGIHRFLLIFCFTLTSVRDKAIGYAKFTAKL
jgi:hypothetical protein